MTESVIRATPETVHWGVFDAGLPPLLRIWSGERIRIETISGGPAELPTSGFEILPEYRPIHEAHRPRFGRGHILTGPLWVEDAEPGDALEVRILDVQLRQDWATT
jgi:acetamidase/formamidase